MRIAKLLFIGGLLLLYTSCVPTGSVNPLYTEKDLVYDPSLVGTWAATSEYPKRGYTFLEFKEAEKDSYELTVTLVPDGGSSNWKARLLKLDKYSFLDLYPKTADQPQIHIVLRIRLDTDRLRISYLDDDWVKQNVNAQKISLVREGDVSETPVLTAPTAELQQLVVKYAEDPKAFVDMSAEFTREQSVASYQRMLEVAYRALANADLENGQVDEAILHLKRYLELKPDDVDMLYRLGFAYLAKGEYEQAMKEYREMSRWSPPVGAGGGSAFCPRQKEFCDSLRLRPDQASAHYHLGFVAFVQGRFENAVNEFRVYRSMTNSPVLYPILWEYLALRRLARESESRDLLRHYTGKFQTWAWQRDLLDYFQGKITDTELITRKSFGFDTCEAYFYIGYQFFLAGDNQKARENLQKAIETKDYTYYEFIGAEALLAELKSMSASAEGLVWRGSRRSQQFAGLESRRRSPRENARCPRVDALDRQREIARDVRRLPPP